MLASALRPAALAALALTLIAPPARAEPTTGPTTGPTAGLSAELPLRRVKPTLTR